MKNMKLVFAGIAFAFISLEGMAQDKETSRQRNNINYINPVRGVNWLPDSIKVEMPEQKAILIFQFRELTRNLAVVDEFSNQLEAFTALISRSLSSTNEPQAVNIKVSGDKELEIEIHNQQMKSTRIRATGLQVTELLPPGWELTVRMKEAKITVYVPTFKDLESLSHQSFQPVKDQLKSELALSPLFRKSLVSRMVVKENRIAYNDSKRIMAGDFLELNLGTGLGFIEDKFYPQISPIVSFQFGDRFHRPDYQFLFSYQTMFFATRKANGGYLTYPNSFVTAAWSKNLIFKSGNPSWLGIGAGLLVRRSGDYFSGRTAKFFITKDIGSFKISPEAYLTNDFKTLQTGISLHFMF